MKTLAKVIIVLLTGVALNGCTNGAITDEDKNKEFTCFDSRDESSFKYNTNTLTNIMVGSDGSKVLFSMDLVTHSGKKLHIDQDTEVFLTCVETELIKIGGNNDIKD